MPYFEFFWTDEIIEHLAEHGVTPDDFERVVNRPVDVPRVGRPNCRRPLGILRIAVKSLLPTISSTM